MGGRRQTHDTKQAENSIQPRFAQPGSQPSSRLKTTEGIGESASGRGSSNRGSLAHLLAIDCLYQLALNYSLSASLLYKAVSTVLLFCAPLACECWFFCIGHICRFAS